MGQPGRRSREERRRRCSRTRRATASPACSARAHADVGQAARPRRHIIARRQLDDSADAGPSRPVGQRACRSASACCGARAARWRGEEAREDGRSPSRRAPEPERFLEIEKAELFDLGACGARVAAAVGFGRGALLYRPLLGRGGRGPGARHAVLDEAEGESVARVPLLRLLDSDCDSTQGRDEAHGGRRPRSSSSSSPRGHELDALPAARQRRRAVDGRVPPVGRRRARAAGRQVAAIIAELRTPVEVAAPPAPAPVLERGRAQRLLGAGHEPTNLVALDDGAPPRAAHVSEDWLARSRASSSPRGALWRACEHGAAAAARAAPRARPRRGVARLLAGARFRAARGRRRAARRRRRRGRRCTSRRACT